MIDWDWPAQLKTCQARIVDLEEKITAERWKVQRLLSQNLNATYAQRMLALREQSLQRVQSHVRLIESRMAERATEFSSRPLNVGSAQASVVR